MLSWGSWSGFPSAISSLSSLSLLVSSLWSLMSSCHSLSQASLAACETTCPLMPRTSCLGITHPSGPPCHPSRVVSKPWGLGVQLPPIWGSPTACFASSDVTVSPALRSLPQLSVYSLGRRLVYGVRKGPWTQCLKNHGLSPKSLCHFHGSVTPVSEL